MARRPRRPRTRTRKPTMGRRLHWQEASAQGDLVVIGRLRRPFGLRGAMLLEILTDYPEARFYPGATIYVGPRRVPLVLKDVQPHRDGLLVTFEGLEDRTAVEPLRNQWITITRDEVLPVQSEEDYYDFQVLGARVETEAGRVLGRLVEILETGANDVFVVEPEKGEEILLPVIADVVREIRPEEGVVIVRLLPGLLPEGHPLQDEAP